MTNNKVVFSKHYRALASIDTGSWKLISEPTPFAFMVSESMVNHLLHRSNLFDLSYVAYLDNEFCVITESEAAYVGLPKNGYNLERVYDLFDDPIGWTPCIRDGAWLDVTYDWNIDSADSDVYCITNRLLLDYPITYKRALDVLKKHFSSLGGPGFCEIQTLRFGPYGTDLSERAKIDLTSRKYMAGSYGQYIKEMLCA